MRTQPTIIADIIQSIGHDNFPIVTARALCEFAKFDFALIAIHKSSSEPTLLFDDFDAIGGRIGIENYLSFTHRLNPFLASQRSFSAFRARDFKIKPRSIDPELRPHVSKSPDEELGFLTTGWPRGLAEVGIYFPVCGGIAEISMYREQTRTPTSRSQMRSLSALCEPLAAAFDRHHLIAAVNTAKSPLMGLSPREEQIAQLLLTGCTTEAVALRLQITIHTVKSYRKQIFRKLGICSLAELFALCWRNTSANNQEPSLVTPSRLLGVH